MAENQSAENAGPSPKGSRRLAPMLIIAALMLGEGIGVYLLANALSPAPVSVQAEGGQTQGGQDTYAGSSDWVEVDLAECRPSNKMSGRLVTFHIRVSGLVDPKKREEIKEIVRAKQARIDDAVNVVIRGAEPPELNEPGLETIRRRLKHELGRVFGDDELVRQVLIPQLLQSGPGL